VDKRLEKTVSTVVALHFQPWLWLPDFREWPHYSA